MPRLLTLLAGLGAGIALVVAASALGASPKSATVKAGRYRFTTKAGEDYMKGVKTIGEDNVLRLTVSVE
jgi:hypothetical protein